MDDPGAISSLISDLYWQIDQLPRRGVKDAAGNPYNPSYYKRGLKRAVDTGGLAVADYVRRYLYRPPSDGYKKLEEADSLDLACEALVADADKPYARLFTDADRRAARKRLAPHMEAIEQRRVASKERVANQRLDLPDDLAALRQLAANAEPSERAVAINQAIVSREPRDTVALNRLGRAYEAIGAVNDAQTCYSSVLGIDPANRVARRRLYDLEARQRARTTNEKPLLKHPPTP
jgi:tetratricopeptide (TPR) repeat protein